MTLSVEHLTAGYKGHTVLDDVSLAVTSGEVAALAGPNGAGKSTLLAIMAGINRVSHPSLVVNDGVHPFITSEHTPVIASDSEATHCQDRRSETISSMPASRRAQLVSFMAQSEQSAWNYSALEVVRMGRYAHSRGRPSMVSIRAVCLKQPATQPPTSFGALGDRYAESDTRAARDALAMVGAAGLEERGVLTLSSGQWQRVRLARAVAQDAPFMLLDEPDTGLDMGFREEFLSILRALSRERGVGVLFSTHDVNSAARYCDTLALLDAAGHLEAGTAGDMMTTEHLSKVYGCNIEVTHHSVLGAVAYVGEP